MGGNALRELITINIGPRRQKENSTEAPGHFPPTPIQWKGFACDGFWFRIWKREQANGF